jgi:hypothetical protein
MFSRNPMVLCHKLWADSTQDTKEASDWGEVVVRCFPTLLNCRLTTRMINSPSNGMMLVDSLHKAFRCFHMAFVNTVSPTQYSFNLIVPLAHCSYSLGRAECLRSQDLSRRNYRGSVYSAQEPQKQIRMRRRGRSPPARSRVSGLPLPCG